MKTIEITFSDKEYAKLQECKTARFRGKSDIYVIKYAVTLYIRKKRASLATSNEKRIQTLRKNQRQRDKEAAINFFKTRKQNKT